MKCTEDTKTWTHVICALLMPEVRFGDPAKLEPITNIEKVKVHRFLFDSPPYDDFPQFVAGTHASALLFVREDSRCLYPV
jgi:hypothetical protein